MATLALMWGIGSFLGFCLGLIPCLGWFNWINIPFSIGGVVLGSMALARESTARRPVGPAVAGLLLSLVAVVFGFARLVLGGFVF
jgi:hypothetical protein